MNVLKSRSIWARFVAVAAFALPTSVIVGYLIGGVGVAVADLIAGIAIFVGIGMRIRRFTRPS
jgi:hypothetical protein